MTKNVPREQKAEYAQVISLIARFDTLQKLVGLVSNIVGASFKIVTILNRYQRTKILDKVECVLSIERQRSSKSLQ